MIVELKKGYTIESNYDKNTRSYITVLKDKDGNQVRDAYYSNNMTDRNTDVESIKEFFYDYIYYNKSKGSEFKEPEEIIDIEEDEFVEESLDSKIAETKRKTKKAKLPALSTLSPIMPDGAAGISTFNSGVGLSEEYLDRNELIKRISKMGFKYKFDKYSDKALYRIYQERLRELEHRQKVKREKKQKEDEIENKRVNSKDSYFKNGIEFESEDAAREYFGESMDNKIYLNDMHKAWDIDESWGYRSSDLYDKWGDDPESLRIEEVEPGYWTVFDHNGNGSYYFGSSEEDCANWCADNGEKYFIYSEVHESIDRNSKNILTESVKKKPTHNKHNFKTITEGLKYFERKEFNENYRDAELELLYEGVKNNLDQDDIKKLGSFLKNAKSADDVATYIKGLLSEDVNELTEARKPKYVDSLFGRHVKDAMDKGELTYNNIKEWDRNYNDGRDPIPAFNTRELMNFYSNHPNYFDESLNEDMDSAKDNLFYKAYDARSELMDDILEKLGCTSDTCETLKDIPTDIKRKAFSMWLKEVRELARWNDDMDSQVYEIIDLVDSSNLGESLQKNLNESLNNYYVREWWGQVDENPFDVAAMYNLDVHSIKTKHDSTLYEFRGSLEDLNKAKSDGYFYDSNIVEVKGDIEILKELVEGLEKVGFILDESTLNGGLTNTRGQNWHLQVINPNMQYPNSETEGEDISEEIANKLFIDDLKEVVQVLDKVERKYPYIFITFNFGANKDNVVTGGIDMRMSNGK